MKVLFLTQIWPEDNASGASTRTLQLVEMFKDKGWQIHVWSDAELNSHSSVLEKAGYRSFRIGPNDHRFDAEVRALLPDVVVFDRFSIEEKFGFRVWRECPGALRILDTVDLHSVRVYRSKQLASLERTALCCPGFDFDDFVQRQDGLWEREIAAVFRSDLVLVVSDFERDVLVRSFKVPVGNVQLCRLSYPRRESSPPGYLDRQSFVAIGSFRHPPNVDALNFLLDHFWPLLRARLPHAELEIWGSHMTPGHVRQMPKQAGVQVKGYAPCALEVLARARVHLALVRFGAGIKTKISDAFFAGTPTVTTPIGAEGMLDGAEFPGFVSGDLSEAVDQAVLLHENQAVWKEKAELTRAVLQKSYTAESTTVALGQAIDAIVERLPQHRNANPLGRVFWHQSCRSTEYFSRWIELKERSRISEDDPLND